MNTLKVLSPPMMTSQGTLIRVHRFDDVMKSSGECKMNLLKEFRRGIRPCTIYRYYCDNALREIANVFYFYFLQSFVQEFIFIDNLYHI